MVGKKNRTFILLLILSSITQFSSPLFSHPNQTTYSKSYVNSCIFSHQPILVVCHYNMSDSKSPQVFRTLLSIQADLKKAVACVVWILSLISNSSNTLSSVLVTVPRAELHLISPSHSRSTAFFLNLCWRPCTCLSSKLSFIFTHWSSGNA